MKTSKTRWIGWAVVSLWCLWAGPLPAEAPTPGGAPACVKEIKCATIAPAGSAWDKIMVEAVNELRTQTAGKLCIKNYAGGVQGDEKAVVQKLRFGQLDCAGLTGFGLGEIASAVRVLELPFLFEDPTDLDKLTSGLAKDFDQAFAAGNPPVVNVGWTDVGPVYMFSQQPLQKVEQLKGVKIWQWEGDPLAEALFKAIKVTPVTLSLPNVLTSLQTGMISAAYGPPLGVLALQWAPKTKYMTMLPVTYAVGALVVKKDVMEKLPADQQKVLREVMGQSTRQISIQTRKDNVQAIESIKKLGIQTLPVDPTDRAEFVQIARTVWKDLASKLYTPQLLEKTKSILGVGGPSEKSASAQPSQ